MNKKSLTDISWQVSEPEYRADPALSYSTLAKFEREGFENLDKLFDRVESPSLTFGSCVDCLLTDGQDAFDKQYFVSSIPPVKPSAEPVIKEVYDRFHNSYTNIYDIPDSELMPIISQMGYMANTKWRPETKCKDIRDAGYEYYQTMFMAGDKTVLPQDIYNRIFACVRALKDSPQTRAYFADDDPFSDVEHYYQLKFRGVLDNVDYRCMADLILVNHKTKTVTPCDLKTSSHREYNFPESFLQWRYDIQARLYWRLIRQAMDKDEYFKSFKLEDYRFIVVNNIDNPTPVVWQFSHTASLGDITIGGKYLRDPENIGIELSKYIEMHPPVPFNISLEHPNNIEGWLNMKNHGQ